MKKWAANEDDIVRAMWPDKPAIRKRLQGRRTLVAIQSRGAKLGLRKPLSRWTAREVTLLRKLWPSTIARAEIRAALPRFDDTAVRMQARHLGLRRPPQFGRLIGDHFADRVRVEAIRHGLSNRGLDAMLGLKGTFLKGCGWRLQQHVVRAAEALGGTVRIVWED